MSDPTVLAAPPAPAPTDLVGFAHALLDAVGAAFDAAGLGLSKRRYVTTGQPTAECEALAVSWSSIGFRVPGFAPAPVPVRLDNVRSAELTVWAFRCQEGTASGTGRRVAAAPSVDKLNGDGDRAMTDGLTMHRAVVAARRAGTFGDFARGMAVGDVTPLQPEGGICGVWMSVVVQLS